MERRTKSGKGLPMTYKILLLSCPLLLAGCYSHTPTCGDSDAESLLQQQFRAAVAGLMARDYSNVSTARATGDQLTAGISGLHETDRNDERGTCTGEAMITVPLDPVVANRLQDPSAAQWLPTVLGDVEFSDSALRTTVAFTIANRPDGKTELRADALGDLVSAAITLTMQRAAEFSARARD